MGRSCACWAALGPPLGLRLVCCLGCAWAAAWAVQAAYVQSLITCCSQVTKVQYTMKFNPAGTIIASGSHDKDIFLWYIHGDCKNFMALRGHKDAVLNLQWTTDGTQIISASPDKTLRAWDVETGKQVKKMAEHSSFVNSCCPSRRGPPLVVSGSDDGTAKLRDLRQ